MAMKEKYKYLLLCACAGAALAASFPAANLIFLAWAAFIPLFYVICKTEKPVYSSIYAFFAGLVFNLLANLWLLGTVNLYANSYPASITFYICFCLYFAFYWGVWGLFSSFIKKYCQRAWLFVILSACLWIILEYVRANILSGWPWLIVGFSQYLFTYMIQIAEFAGVYGVSFVIMLVNGLLYFAISERKKSYAFAAAILFAAVLIFGIFRSNSFKDFGEKEYTAAAVQSNIEQYKKLDNTYKAETYLKLEETAEILREIGADVNVWSESEIINLIPADINSYNFADKLAKTAGDFNIIGAPYIDGNGNLFNTVFYFDGAGGYRTMHFKNHLVPFGEYTALPDFLAKFIGVYGRSDDPVRGTDTTVFTDGELYIGPLICSENFFPDIVSRFILSGAKVLTNHTNDAWYLDSSAPYKHFSANVFRSVESRKAMIVAANTGISAIIDASGKIVVSTRVYERAVITGTFLQNDYLTFYVLYGDMFVGFCMLFVSFFILIIFLRRYILKNGKKKNI